MLRGHLVAGARVGLNSGYGDEPARKSVSGASAPTQRDILRAARLPRAVTSRITYLTIQSGTSLLVFLLLARVLSTQELARVAVALAVYVAVQIISDLGVSQAATVQIPHYAVHDPPRARRIQAASARLYLYGSAVAVLLTALVSLLVPEGDRLAVVAIAPASGAALLVTGAESLARASGDLRAPVLFALAGRGSVFLLTPFLIVLTPGAVAIMLGWSAAALTGSIPALLRLRSLARTGKTPRGSALKAEGILRFAVGIGIAGIIVTLATRGAVIVISHVGSSRDVSSFEAAWRVFQFPLYAAGALGTATTPFASHALTQGGRTALRRLALPVLIGLVAAGSIAAGLLAWSAPLISGLLYGSQLGPPTASVIRVLAIALPVSVVVLYLQTAIAMPLMLIGALVRSATIGCVVTLIATALLVPAWGAPGAAASVGAGQFLTLMFLVFEVARSGGELTTERLVPQRSVA